jgi:hypothetical protein
MRLERLRRLLCPLVRIPGRLPLLLGEASPLTQLTEANGQGRVLLDPAFLLSFLHTLCAAEMRQCSSDGIDH